MTQRDSEGSENGFDPQESESNETGLWGRVRQGLGVTRDRAAGAVDTITGIQFRRHFEDFTEAVTTAVVGVYRDNDELKQQTDQLGVEVANAQREQVELRNSLDQLNSAVANTQREQVELRNNFDQMDSTLVDTQRKQVELTEKTTQLEQRQTAYLPPTLIVALGIMSMLALIFSIVATVRTF